MSLSDKEVDIFMSDGEITECSKYRYEDNEVNKHGDEPVLGSQDVMIEWMKSEMMAFMSRKMGFYKDMEEPTISHQFYGDSITVEAKTKRIRVSARDKEISCETHEDGITMKTYRRVTERTVISEHEFYISAEKCRYLG